MIPAKEIKTWRQRCEEHPDHNVIVSDEMVQARMQEEIDELRSQRQWKGLTKDEVAQWELPNRPTVFEFAKFVEAKLREKNT